MLRPLKVYGLSLELVWKCASHSNSAQCPWTCSELWWFDSSWENVNTQLVVLKWYVLSKDNSKETVCSLSCFLMFLSGVFSLTSKKRNQMVSVFFSPLEKVYRLWVNNLFVETNFLLQRTSYIILIIHICKYLIEKSLNCRVFWPVCAEDQTMIITRLFLFTWKNLEELILHRDGKEQQPCSFWGCPRLTTEQQK